MLTLRPELREEWGNGLIVEREVRRQVFWFVRAARLTVAMAAELAWAVLVGSQAAA